MNQTLSFFELFSDPIFRGPMLGSLLMSLSASLVGAITFVRRKSLVGEALAHATFPGVAIGVLLAGWLFPDSDAIAFLFILIGAFIASLIGQCVIEKMLTWKQKPDVTLCYVLSGFLGLGVLLASFMQQSHVIGYQKIQLFFYGQAATMTDLHVYIYGILALCVLLVIIVLNRPIKAVCFDPIFSESIGIKRMWMIQCCSFLLSLAIVIGIRSVGVVLITGMLIAPAVAAKCFTEKFSHFLTVSAFVGMVSSLVGNYLTSIGVVQGEVAHYLPTGPSVVVIAALIAFFALVFSPKKGVLIKAIRQWHFQRSCILENLLKAFWRREERSICFKEIFMWKVAGPVTLYAALRKLLKQGWLQKTDSKHYILTEDGRKKAAYIVRLHRLWELYLAEHLEDSLEHIHHSAEEMEHLITPDIEEKLTKLLLNPTKDPHKQPIPGKELL